MIKLALVKLRFIYQYTVFSAFVTLSMLLTGCVYDPYYYGPPSHSHYSPYYYDYYYYPSVQVYFHFTTGFYFYRDRGVWLKVRVLPPHININARDRVKLKIESEKPYLRFPDHASKYKPNPKYRVEKEQSLKERNANKRWFEDYKQKKDKPKKVPKKKKDKEKRGRY